MEIAGEATAARRTKTLYLVRHAMTAANLSGRKLGMLDEPLGREGREQARALARRIGHLRVDGIWTSPLARAEETARIVALALGAPVRVEPGLREMALGPWEGLTEAEIARRFPSQYARWQSDAQTVDLPGHEGLAGTQRRVVAALERIMVAADRAVCVTHLTPIRLAWVYYEGVEPNRYVSITPDHCSLMVLERRGDAIVWREPG